MGWSETVVTSVYEYREVKSTRSVRGGRLLLDDLHKLLQNLAAGDAEPEDAKPEDVKPENTKPAISFEECEEVLCRLMWCRSSAYKSSQRQSAQLETVEEQDESEAETPDAPDAPPPSRMATIPLRSTTPPSAVEVPFEKLADVCDDIYFHSSALAVPFDDHELPAHLLVYQHLLQLPMDVRAICMSRITFTGGCSNILGIRERVIDELTSMIERRGWEPVSGKGPDQLRNKLKLQKGSSPPIDPPATASETKEEQTESPRDSVSGDPAVDPVGAKVARNRPTTQQIQGQVRVLHSLGPWTGASLLSQLKVPAMATIDRDLWLQQGANGASRPSDVDVKIQQRQSMGAGGLIRGSGGHHTNWTLGNWGAL